MHISILTVCFNSASTIIDTLLSVQRQTYKKTEHVIVDGGSSDGTVELIEKFRIHSSKFVSEKDSGIYDALNKGIKLCTGDYIIILHSDDIFHNELVIESAVEFIRESNYCDIVFGSVLHVSEIFELDKAYLYSSRLFRKWQLIFGFIPAHNGTFVKRVVYLDTVYDESFISAGDYNWFFRFFKKNDRRYKAMPLIVSRQRLGGVSTRGLSSIMLSNKEIIRTLYPKLFFLAYILILFRLPIKFFARRRKWNGKQW